MVPETLASFFISVAGAEISSTVGKTSNVNATSRGAVILPPTRGVYSSGEPGIALISVASADISSG